MCLRVYVLVYMCACVCVCAVAVLVSRWHPLHPIKSPTKERHGKKKVGSLTSIGV